MIYIGIDPGKSGALAVIHCLKDGTKIKAVPFDEEAYVNELRHVAQYTDLFGDEVYAVVEKVHAMPKQGSVSMFSFGQNFGFIQGALKSFGIPFELVRPDVWKKALDCKSDKTTSIAVCKRLFPKVSLKRTDKCKVDDDGVAEALLLAEYGRRIRK